jgi:hypothetical protein
LYQWFIHKFNAWVDELNLGRWVPHQARHTPATSLLRHGTSLTHIRRCLGQVSDCMAEQYVHLSQSDREGVLSTSGWPGRVPPTLASCWTGKLPARSHASRPTPSPSTLPAAVPPPRAASAHFQPVVDGGGRIWSLECHN